MPKPIASKSKNNPPQSFPSFPPNQMQPNVYYPADPNMMYATDPYQQMMMDPNQQAQYQMGYYPPQGYPPQGYPMILDEGHQISDSPKSTSKSEKQKPKNKFSLFKSSKKVAEREEPRIPKDSAIPTLPPITPSERNQSVSMGNSKQPDNIKGNNEISDVQDEQYPNDDVSASLEVDDSRSTLDPTSGNINVVIRVRPPNALELKNGYSPVIDCANDGETLFVNGPDGRSRALTFNRVYDQNSTQEIFFNQSGIKELISQAMEGYSICIFAFGQTGSGKNVLSNSVRKIIYNNWTGIATISKNCWDSSSCPEIPF